MIQFACKLTQSRLKANPKCWDTKLQDKKYQVNIYLLKVNNRNSRKGCEIPSKPTMKLSGFIVDFEYANLC